MKKHNFAVIFDMDGVIVNNNLYHKKAWKLFCKRHNLDITKREFELNVYGKTNSDILIYLFEQRLSKKQISKYAKEKESIYRNVYKKYVKSTKGLAKFLKFLEKNRIKHAIATSAPSKNVNMILTKIKMKKYFKIIVDATNIRKGKPHPEIYLKTAKEMNFNPSKCIVFEDSISGIKAARNAGMKVIAVHTKYSKKELKADIIISNFTQVGISDLESIIKPIKAIK